MTTKDRSNVIQATEEDTVMQPAAVQHDVMQPVNQDNSKGAKSKKTDTNSQFKLEHIIAKVKNGHAVEKIVKPDGSGGRDFHVRDSIGLSHDATWYSDILVRFYYFY